MLMYRGKLDAKKVGRSKDRNYAALQFVERLPDGGLKMVDIYLPDGYDHSEFIEGQDVEVAVRVSASNGKIFYNFVPYAPSGKRKNSV